MKRFVTWACCFVLAFGSLQAAGSFADRLGQVSIGPPPSIQKTVEVPFILWGGDVATFHANGGTQTQPGSIYQKLGLDLKLNSRDDLLQQTREYLEGKSPFIRCTMRMAGIISEVINRDERTQGVVFMQLTWSAGDHMVSRGGVQKANDLKGKKVALQEFGPHVGMLDDILKSASLNWSDIQVVWTRDISGPEGPAEAFIKDTSIDACFVITPDMIGLTGGADSVGSGAEGTVKGAKVAISTAQLSRSISDVYLCRNDFFRANKAWVESFTLGYLQGVQSVEKNKAAYEKGGSKTYESILQMTQDIYGADLIPTLEEDAHGLILDCEYVGQPGNLAFFFDPKSLQNFQFFNRSALECAYSNGYISRKIDFLPSGVGFTSPKFSSALSKFVQLQQLQQIKSQSQKFNVEALRDEIEAFQSGEGLDDNTLVSFTISFAPDQIEFDQEAYRQDFERALRLSSQYGNAALVIEGHSDPTKCLVTLVKAGLSKGVLKRVGSRGNFQYYMGGKLIDFGQTHEVQRAIEAGHFDGVPAHNPREIMIAAKNLSLKRAAAVRDSMFTLAKSMGVAMDASQVQPVGVGIVNPIIPKPSNVSEAAVNRRVEFKLVRVSAEALSEDDFDF